MNIKWTSIDYNNAMRVSFESTINGVKYQNMLELDPNMDTTHLINRLHDISGWMVNVRNKEVNHQGSLL